MVRAIQGQAGGVVVMITFRKKQDSKQVRCKNCQIHPFYNAALDDRPFIEDCPECLGMDRDHIPWTELFITGPERRR